MCIHMLLLSVNYPPPTAELFPAAQSVVFVLAGCHYYYNPASFISTIGTTESTSSLSQEFYYCYDDHAPLQWLLDTIHSLRDSRRLLSNTDDEQRNSWPLLLTFSSTDRPLTQPPPSFYRGGGKSIGSYQIVNIYYSFRIPFPVRIRCSEPSLSSFLLSSGLYLFLLLSIFSRQQITAIAAA